MVRLLIFICINICSVSIGYTQKKECKQKPKRFPSHFTHMTSDYANMNLQADVLPKRYYQLESSFLFGAIFKNVPGDKYYGYNSNLIRIGLGRSLELRGVFAIPGQNVIIDQPKIKEVHPPLGLGLKVALLSESSSNPGVAFEAEYLYYNRLSHYQASLVFDKLLFNILKVSLSAGPQFSSNETTNYLYSSGITMKDHLKKLGVYALVSNRYSYLMNIFHMGIIYSDNLNYQLTAGYGVHESHGLFMISFTGLINYSNLQRRFGYYFD